jgi:DNA sulfur modification protein DndB
MSQEDVEDDIVKNNKPEERIIVAPYIGKKKRAILFEQKIKSFLEELEFENVDGARDDFLINGLQVDACGGWENALLVIECKSAQELKRKSLRETINSLRGKISLFEKGFSNHPKYKNYTFFKYIIATKNYEIRHEDILFANQDPRIYIWSDSLIEYYEDQNSYLKPYAKFDLLGEMGIKPMRQDPISIPAFKVDVGNNVNMFNFVMNPKDLLSVSFVARREKRNERFYQRIIDKNRLDKIAKYINSGGSFPNNIIISFRPEMKVKFHPIKYTFSSTDWPYLNLSFGILEFPRDYRSCWIIDGQHRLYAFARTESAGFNMPITAFNNLDLENQCKFFLDINKNQKPVDPDLLWDLNGDMIPSEREGIISNVVKSLNGMEPLHHRIFYPSTGIKKKLNHIKISALCTAIKKAKLVDQFTSQNIKNPFYQEKSEEIIKRLGKSLSEYFDEIKKILNQNWNLEKDGFIITNGGSTVMIALYAKIVEHIMQKQKRMVVKDDFQNYLNPLKKYFQKKYDSNPSELKSLRLRCASEGGKKEVLEDFVRIIKQDLADDTFGGEIETTKYMKEFNNLEKKLKSLIYYLFFDSHDINWFEHTVVDKGIFGRALKHMRQNGITDLNKVYLQIGLGDCFAIIRLHKEKFYPFFIGNDCEDKFSSDSVFEGMTSFISSMRGKCEAHYTGNQLTGPDEQMLKLVLEKMNGCLDLALETTKRT